MELNDKIYISGSSGFVGSALYNKLKELGYKNIITKTHQELNLSNLNKVGLFFEKYKPNVVIMCAAKVGGIIANINNQYEFLYENLMIQNNLIQACINYKINKAIFLGSSCIYPKDYKQPLKEEYLLKGDFEESNYGYALSKVAGLKLCQYSNEKFNTNFICLMPSNLYGKGNSFDLKTSHVLQALVKKICDARDNGENEVEIFGNGKPKREFMYIDDMVDGIIWALNNLQKIETFLNIGTGIDITIKELAEKISTIVGYDGKFIFNTEKPNGMMKKCLDISKIKSLGWKPRVSLDQGLIKTIDYYRSLKVK